MSFASDSCHLSFSKIAPANEMQPQNVIITLIFTAFQTFADVPRPRGVSLSRAPLYDPSKAHFACLDGAGLQVPFERVNDDYCDCPDGSDEPGTSACPQGTFHCTNAGHRPLNIPSSRVNDGICDCCDGSDEYARGHCANECLEKGRSAREEAQRQAELIRAGKQQRTEMSQRGKQLKQEKKEKLESLLKNRDEAVKVKQEKEAIKQSAEALENELLEAYRKIEEENRKRQAEADRIKEEEEIEDTFKLFDSNSDGKVDISELQTRQTFDKDRNGEVSIDEAKYFLNEEESADFPAFKEKCWPNIKTFLLKDQGLYKPPSEEQSEETDTSPEPEEDFKTNYDDEEEEEMEEPTDEEEEEADQPEVSQPEEPAHSKYDERTQAAVDTATAARSEHSDAERAVRDIETEIQRLNSYLDTDFGPDEEFAPLQGVCFEYTDREYVYKLCPFDRTTQKQISGSSETRLGGWARWSGPEGDKHSQMLYDGGQSCWNGPQRSTRVEVKCGGEDKLISVEEPNRCEYRFGFETPAACREPEGTEATEDVHDEL